MRRTELWAIVALGIGVAGCTFDGSTDFEPSFEAPLLDGFETGTAQPGEEPAPDVGRVEYLAVDEDTRKGDLVDGDFEDSHAVDGVFEVIEAEIKGANEELEHIWFFESIPSGEHQLTLVGLPYSPEPIDTFVVEYAEDGVRGHNLVFVLDPKEEVMTFEASLLLEEGADVEIRVKLPKNTEVVGEDEVPFRRIDVDYLALSPADS